MIGSIANIAKIPELKRRVLFTLLLLLVYRLGVHVPTPGINTLALKEFFGRYQQTLFGVIDMFTGGALENFSVFSLGIMPYISASIILQLLTVVVPHLERLSKEGGSRKKENYPIHSLWNCCSVSGSEYGYQHWSRQNRESCLHVQTGVRIAIYGDPYGRDRFYYVAG